MSDNLHFFRNNQRPDWILTGTKSNAEVWGDTFMRMMGVEPGGAVMLPKDVSVTVLPVAQSCRYCRVPRARARTTCENCGAPYPALTV